MIREELKNLAAVARGDGNVNLYVGGYNVALACDPKYAPDIIRAVRSHNALVEALDGLLRSGDTDARGLFRIRGIAESAGVMTRARAALAAAKET